MTGVRYTVDHRLCGALRAIVAGLPDRSHGRVDRVYCVRSRGARTMAVARIYGLPRPWIVVGLEPGYVIEFVSERFDPLPCREKIAVIIHELLHIPRTFSGALRPHGRQVNDGVVERLLDRLPGWAFEEACRLLRG